jgi:glycosyltransferase involved in cell wall biosynthesis
MHASSKIHQVAIVGDYLPRKCGIATFTSDLCNAIAREHADTHCFVVPVNDVEGGYDYPECVRFEIDEQDFSSYQRASDFLNISNVDVVSLQHEFGIFGGNYGSHVLALLRELKMPVVTTLHTILREPKADQRRVMQEVVAQSTRLVVMTGKGAEFLENVYGVPPEKIDLIPHGIPDMPFVDPNYYKDKFGVEGRLVLLTFGLLSPNKGIESVLHALPEIVKEFPNLVYIVLGATHPNLVREQGEAYRFSLERLAKGLHIQKHVIFHDRFVSVEELKEFIGAADLYITPYLNEAQITSGTLSYAFGAGKAVISTPYWHAQELLAEDRGVLVPFGDPTAIAREVVGLLKDETRRHAMRKKAYKLGREMVWSNVARMYMKSFSRARWERSVQTRISFAVKTLDEQARHLPMLKLDHLFRMTDSTGLFQHATFSVPNFAEGYCTDDNARALIMTVLLEELGEDSVRVRSLASTYAAFLNYAFNPVARRFRNFMSFDRRWLEDQGSEDSHARTLWALGTCVGRSRRRSFQLWAGQLFNQALPAVLDFTAVRGWAFSLIGINEYLRRLSGDRLAAQIREQLVDRVLALFQQFASEDWPWCEGAATYDNAKIAHALIASGVAMGRQDALDTGLKALRWLAQVQTTSGGYFRPIGNNGFYRRGEEPAKFDQQPIEVHAMVSACLEAYRTTNDNFWYDQAQRAFDWFLGWNDLGSEMYAPNTGGCYDGLRVDRINQNQGAESSLAFLLSLAEMKLTQNVVTVFQQPLAASA